MTLVRGQNSFSLKTVDPLPSYSHSQLELDGLQAGFSHEALNPSSLLGMIGAGFAFHAGRTLSLGITSNLLAPPRSLLTSQLLRLTSNIVGFGTEVFAFEGLTRSSRILFEGADRSLLGWNGEQGFRQGLLNGALSLGSLKLSGHIFQTRNILLQHFIQDTAMVGSHQFAAWMNWEHRPTGNFAKQYLHAEATLLQMNTGMRLVHGTLPGLRSLEKSLDLPTHQSSPHPSPQRSSPCMGYLRREVEKILIMGTNHSPTDFSFAIREEVEALGEVWLDSEEVSDRINEPYMGFDYDPDTTYQGGILYSPMVFRDSNRNSVGVIATVVGEQKQPGITSLDEIRRNPQIFALYKQAGFDFLEDGRVFIPGIQEQNRRLKENNFIFQWQIFERPADEFEILDGLLQEPTRVPLTIRGKLSENNNLSHFSHDIFTHLNRYMQMDPQDWQAYRFLSQRFLDFFRTLPNEVQDIKPNNINNNPLRAVMPYTLDSGYRLLPWRDPLYGQIHFHMYMIVYSWLNPRGPGNWWNLEENPEILTLVPDLLARVDQFFPRAWSDPGVFRQALEEYYRSK